MRKFALTVLVIAFAGACAHKHPAQPKTDDKAAPTTTKDQAPPEKSKKHKKATAAATASSATSVKCAHNSDERMIEIKDVDGGCETVYTKMGEAKSIATSAHGKEHCQEVSEKIQKNLATAGFTCQ